MRVYRFWNYSAEQFGAPFSICDQHVKTYNPPFLETGLGYLAKLADRSVEECELCVDERRAAERAQASPGRPLM